MDVRQSMGAAWLTRSIHKSGRRVLVCRPELPVEEPELPTEHRNPSVTADRGVTDGFMDPLRPNEGGVPAALVGFRARKLPRPSPARYLRSYRPIDLAPLARCDVTEYVPRHMRGAVSEWLPFVGRIASPFATGRVSGECALALIPGDRIVFEGDILIAVLDGRGGFGIVGFTSRLGSSLVARLAPLDVVVSNANGGPPHLCVPDQSERAADAARPAESR
jgi:hypothetical protein